MVSCSRVHTALTDTGPKCIDSATSGIYHVQFLLQHPSDKTAAGRQCPGWTPPYLGLSLISILYFVGWVGLTRRWNGHAMWPSMIGVCQMSFFVLTLNQHRRHGPSSIRHRRHGPSYISGDVRGLDDYSVVKDFRQATRVPFEHAWPFP